MSNYLDTIHCPQDIKNLSISALEALAKEIREYIVDVVSKNGGHLAPNLGVVELTLAIHKVFNCPDDKIVWDVGHQAYVHKILTGRKEEFKTLRQYQGLSGFPKRAESHYDSFDTGHSSTSISAALGIALARDLKKEDHAVVAVIGDGALTGGMAFEALNHAGHAKTDMIVILNDNEMSIAENVGALSNYLTRMRTDPKYYKGKEDIEAILRKIPKLGSQVLRLAERVKDSFKYLVVPGMLFEELGFTYLGPIDGHNIVDVKETLRQAKTVSGPVVVHVLTKKGKGYKPAEDNPDKFHGLGPFDKKTGAVQKEASFAPSYTSVFGSTLVQMAQKNSKVLAISAAMPLGTGLNDFASKFPHRFFDVGIAEQHAVTLAAGLATQGYKPVVAIYSTFLQRAYDQIFHDVCLQNLPVVFALDRGGIVGEDGPTHHGVFDYSYLRHIPNIVVMAPKDENELQHMLNTAIEYNGPIAVRYPRGDGLGVAMDEELQKLPIGKGEILKEGKDAVIIVVGSMVSEAVKASEALFKKGLRVSVINARFIKPLDENLIVNAVKESKVAITVEENMVAGGFGSAVTELLILHNLHHKVKKIIGIGDSFVQHGHQTALRHDLGLDSEGIAAGVLDALGIKETING